MMNQKTVAIPLLVYEDMLEKYDKAKGRIMDLELEIFELQEELDELRLLSGHALN